MSATASASPAPQSAHVQAPEGVILPPPDIREIIEKTASYVHRNGSSFEARIRERETKNVKFNFLNPADPYFPYYEWRLDEFRENKAGNGVVVTATASRSETPAEVKPQGPEEPEPLQFAVPMPPISAQDLDIIRLVALFVARNGRSFASQLIQREERNFQFDFLRPNHSLYQYYQKLVEQYSKVIRPPKEVHEKIDKILSNKYCVLESAQKRAEWQKYKAAESKKVEEEEEAERIAFAQIDWQDFVVVETIDFVPSDETAQLPPPLSRAELEHASLEEKQMMSLFNESKMLAIEEAPPDYGMESDQETREVSASAEEHDQAAFVPPEDTEEEQRIRQRQEALRRGRETKENAAARVTQTMKIRQPGTVRKNLKQQPSEVMQLCPRCKTMIPSSEYSNHLRIELMDPQWKDEKAKDDAHYALSNLNTSDVAANFKRLASTRSDIYDPHGAPLDPEEADRSNKR